MLSLGYELLAVFALVAIVGILMGRFLCKSGESEEREKKKKVIYAYESTQKELEFQQNRVEEYASQLQLKEDYIAECEQTIHNLNTKLESSNQERKQLLEELKVLDKYKSKFESLDKEFEIQSKMLEELKDEKINNQQEIADFKILTNELNKNITQLQKNGEDLDAEIAYLNEQLKDNKEHYERLITNINEAHEAYKVKTFEAYEQDRAQMLKEHKEDKIKMLKEHEDDKVKNLKEHEQYKVKTLKEHEEYKAKTLKEYRELEKKYQEMKSDYKEFVETHNVDSDRLATLEVENEKMYHILKSVEMERDDLLNRLRAISSVVGAVGIEQHIKDESQILLENR